MISLSFKLDLIKLFFMKRLLLFLFALVSFIYSYSQEFVEFKILPDGSITSTQGKSYAVVSFEGYSAEQLYNIVRNKLYDAFENPSSVLIEKPYNSITVHGFVNLGKIVVFIVPSAFGGTYHLKFSFKDGKIRVDRPYFDNPLICTDQTLNNSSMCPSFDDFAKNHFKNGKPKKNYEQIKNIESVFNSFINYILNLNDDEW